VVLGFVYLYNFFTLRAAPGVGARIFRYSLLVLAAAFFEHAVILLYLSIAAARRPGPSTCTTRRITISPCTA
jgi:hypothetical protein